ncbi:MAG: CRTAC1 family protein [Planctomycetes bacterium]|nr:CRTAC1 family protein [Planctomycetota bacterium]
MALSAVLAATALPACKRNGDRDSAPPPKFAPTAVFTDVTVEAGITHTHHKPVLDQKLDNIMSWVASVGAAAAAGDFDRDGWIDLYVTDSRKGEPNHLYRNNGDGTFTDVAASAGVADLNGDKGTSMDCVWGDYDGDGWVDLYVLRWGNDALFRNNGDGTFTDVTDDCFRTRDGKKGTEWANGNAVIFFDYNLDGRLDLYVGNYFDEVDLWHLKTTSIMHDDFEKSRNGGRNFLYRQESDGTFVETAVALGLDDPGWTLAVGSADVNNDGWPDLYCADDFGPDQVFINNGDGTFKNVSGSAVAADTKKGMSVDFGDFNNDGWLDVYVTNITTAEYLQEGNMLWYNNGVAEDGTWSLTDISLETGTYDGGWGWGAKFFDYDNDGDLDIIAVNGFISAGKGNYWYDLASWTVLGEDSADARNWPSIGDRSFSGYETTRFWQNDGFFSFTQRAADVGLDSDRDGRGVVCFDYDNDGDLDLFVANQNQPPHLYRNDARTAGHWLMVALEAAPETGTNRDAIGTRVTIVTPSGRQIRERDGGNGYCGQSDPRVHFGLGSDDRVDLLEIRWPDGGLQYLENIAANAIVRVRQDPTKYAGQIAIKVGSPKAWVPSETPTGPKVPALSPEALDALLTEIEQRVADRPKTFAPASNYRAKCAMYGQHDRAIAFLRRLVEEDPDDARMRIELGCAYIDKIPTCGGLAAIVSKGSLAKKSLVQLDLVIAGSENLWVAIYCRGMNHLHWPRALLHSSDAVVDLKRCLKIQKDTGSPAGRPHYVRTYVLLGDAHAKNMQYDKARSVWRDGLSVFPDSKELKDRLAVSGDAAILEYVLAQRNLEGPIDTGLTFLDRAPKADDSD